MWTVTPLRTHFAQGVKEYEPRVVNQLLDFVYRYVCDVLQDAEVCAPVFLLCEAYASQARVSPAS